MKDSQVVRLKVALRPLGWTDADYEADAVQKTIKGRRHVVRLYEDAVFMSSHDCIKGQCPIDVQEPAVVQALMAIYGALKEA